MKLQVKDSKQKMLVIGAIVAAVLIVALVIVLVISSGTSSDPQGTTQKTEETKKTKGEKTPPSSTQTGTTPPASSQGSQAPLSTGSAQKPPAYTGGGLTVVPDHGGDSSDIEDLFPDEGFEGEDDVLVPPATTGQSGTPATTGVNSSGNGTDSGEGQTPSAGGDLVPDQNTSNDYSPPVILT